MGSATGQETSPTLSSIFEISPGKKGRDPWKRTFERRSFPLRANELHNVLHREGTSRQRDEKCLRSTFSSVVKSFLPTFLCALNTIALINHTISAAAISGHISWLITIFPRVLAFTPCVVRDIAGIDRKQGRSCSERSLLRRCNLKMQLRYSIVWKFSDLLASRNTRDGKADRSRRVTMPFGLHRNWYRAYLSLVSLISFRPSIVPTLIDHWTRPAAIQTLV